MREPNSWSLPRRTLPNTEEEASSGAAAALAPIPTKSENYGLIVADNGSDLYFQGDSNNGWAATAPDGKDTIVDELVGDFHHLTGADFEAVYTGEPVSAGL